MIQRLSIALGGTGAGNTTDIRNNLSIGISNSVVFANMSSDISSLVGNPTGGWKGAGSLNAEGLFINGSAVGLAASSNNITSGNSSVNISPSDSITINIQNKDIYSINSSGATTIGNPLGGFKEANSVNIESLYIANTAITNDYGSI